MDKKLPDMPPCGAGPFMPGFFIVENGCRFGKRKRGAAILSVPETANV